MFLLITIFDPLWSACGVATLGSSHRKIIDSGSQRCEIPSFNPGVSLILMIIVHHSEGGEGGTVWPPTLPALQMSQPRPGENGQFAILMYLQLLYVQCLIVFKCLSFEDFKRFHPSPFKIAFGSLFDNSVLEDKSPFFGMASFC